MKTLYKKTSTGKIQIWEIHVEGNTIITVFGQLGGKLQETKDVITSGKNTGKANATTPEQQAELEAEAQYQKKLKKGYVTTIDDAKAAIVRDIFRRRKSGLSVAQIARWLNTTGVAPPWRAMSTPRSTAPTEASSPPST